MSRSAGADSEIALRLLDGSAGSMAELQRVLEGAPIYAQLVTGAPPHQTDAQNTCSVLPPGKSYEDKFVYGIYLGPQMVGCADLIRGFPDPQTATLGLLLLDEAHQGRGIGRIACLAIEDQVRSWGECTRLRIGIVRTNDRVLPFWSALGFVPSGEVKPYRCGGVHSEVIVLVKSLDVPASGGAAARGSPRSA